MLVLKVWRSDIVLMKQRCANANDKSAEMSLMFHVGSLTHKGVTKLINFHLYFISRNITS